MTNELDKFLNDFDDQSKKNKTDKRELNRKHSIFNKAFKEIISSVVHPAMMVSMEKLRKHDHFGKMLREKFPIRYYYENYKIVPKEAGCHAIISVVGNSDIEKVCIITEYNKWVEHEKKCLKQTEEQYDLSQITAEMFEPIVLKTMNEAYKLKESSSD